MQLVSKFQLARRIQKKVEATLNAQILKIRQETRELHYKLAQELKASMAREAALKQRVKTLELNNPEAKMQADALRDQTRLAERRRRRCRALRQQLQRMYRAGVMQTSRKLFPYRYGRQEAFFERDSPQRVTGCVFPAYFDPRREKIN